MSYGPKNESGVFRHDARNPRRRVRDCDPMKKTISDIRDLVLITLASIQVADQHVIAGLTFLLVFGVWLGVEKGYSQS